MAKSLNLVDLDFNSLKQDLINYLKSNPIFKDYDFVGSNLNQLIEVLAINSQKNAFLTNMLFSEAFLDSAQLTSSVFSHSKDLNYIPRSARSAKAKVQVDFYATSENQPYIIQKGESLSALVKNSQYVFTIPKTIIVSSSNNQFSFTTDIYEGVYVKDTYVYTTNEDNQYPSFKITNKAADTSSLTVAVFEDGSSTGTSYSLATSLLDITNTSQVYFLQVDSKGYYEVLFGDGIIGYKPKENATIILDYRITNDITPNGASSFVLNFDPTGMYNELLEGFQENPKVTTLNIASGGAKQESIESVRYYAPRYFQTQERAVVPSDFETLLKTQFPEIDAVNAYGGEDATPPQYGKVIVALSLSGFSIVPDSKKEEYYQFLRRRTMMAKPIFIDPEYTYLSIESIIRYNINITSNTSERIQTIVTGVIMDYNNNYLSDFNVVLRYSKLISLIDDSDPSIISNITNISCFKKILPELNTSANYVIQFDFALDEYDTRSYPHYEHYSSVFSTNFYYQGLYVLLEDDGNSNINIVQYLNSKYVRVETIGIVDYSSGKIILNNLQIDSYDGSDFRIYVRPKDKDIMAQKNTILEIDPASIKLQIQQIQQ